MTQFGEVPEHGGHVEVVHRAASSMISQVDLSSTQP